MRSCRPFPHTAGRPHRIQIADDEVWQYDKEPKAVISVSLIRSETLGAPSDDWLSATVSTEQNSVVIETEQEQLVLQNVHLLEKIRRVVAASLTEIFYNPKHRMLLIPGAFVVVGSSFLRVDTEAAAGLRD